MGFQLSILHLIIKVILLEKNLKLFGVFMEWSATIGEIIKHLIKIENKTKLLQKFIV
jgi:hypothetical protein